MNIKTFNEMKNNMKKYIKPYCEVTDVQLEGRFLQTSPDTFKDEKGDGVWLAPKNENTNGSFWE